MDNNKKESLTNQRLKLLIRFKDYLRIREGITARLSVRTVTLLGIPLFTEDVIEVMIPDGEHPVDFEWEIVKIYSKLTPHSTSYLKCFYKKTPQGVLKFAIRGISKYC